MVLMALILGVENASPSLSPTFPSLYPHISVSLTQSLTIHTCISYLSPILILRFHILQTDMILLWRRGSNPLYLGIHESYKVKLPPIYTSAVAAFIFIHLRVINFKSVFYAANGIHITICLWAGLQHPFNAFLQQGRCDTSSLRTILITFYGFNQSDLGMFPSESCSQHYS